MLVIKFRLNLIFTIRIFPNRTSTNALDFDNWNHRRDILLTALRSIESNYMFNLHFSKNFNWREFRSTVGSMCSNWQSFHLVYVYYGKRISFQYTLISAAVYLFLLNSNQLPVTPVIQIQAPVQTMNKFCSSRATYYQKQIRNHVVPYVNIALFNLN